MNLISYCCLAQPLLSTYRPQNGTVKYGIVRN